MSWSHDRMHTNGMEYLTTVTSRVRWHGWLLSRGLIISFHHSTGSLKDTGHGNWKLWWSFQMPSLTCSLLYRVLFNIWVYMLLDKPFIFQYLKCVLNKVYAIHSGEYNDFLTNERFYWQWNNAQEIFKCLFRLIDNIRTIWVFFDFVSSILHNVWGQYQTDGFHPTFEGFSF